MRCSRRSSGISCNVNREHNLVVVARRIPVVAADLDVGLVLDLRELLREPRDCCRELEHERLVPLFRGAHRLLRLLLELRRLLRGAHLNLLEFHLEHLLLELLHGIPIVHQLLY